MCVYVCVCVCFCPCVYVCVHVCMCAGLQEGSASLEPMTFSVPSLQSLSLALGAQGHGLRILVLDHNRLGDMGMHLLASGLKR